MSIDYYISAEIGQGNDGISIGKVTAMIIFVSVAVPAQIVVVIRPLLHRPSMFVPGTVSQATVSGFELSCKADSAVAIGAGVGDVSASVAVEEAAVAHPDKASTNMSVPDRIAGILR